MSVLMRTWPSLYCEMKLFVCICVYRLFKSSVKCSCAEATIDIVADVRSERVRESEQDITCVVNKNISCFS